jgi:transposase, IS6 family
MIRQGERGRDTRVMNMLRKGQVRGVSKGDITGQVAFIAGLFAVAA